MGVFVQTRIISPYYALDRRLRIEARDIESVRARARAHIASRPWPRVLFDERRGTQRSEFNRSTFFWCCIAMTVRNMSQIMRLRKVCLQCGTTVHVKRSRCACGHAFAYCRYGAA